MLRRLPEGAAAALSAAVLFGASAPLAKLLLGYIDPWLLASLLYLGSGAGLALLRMVRRISLPEMRAADAVWLGLAIGIGGVLAPVLLMYGLAAMPASAAALLLNAEGLFTALIAWFVFHENFDRRVAAGMLLIVAGAVVLAWTGEPTIDALLPALAVLGACAAWGIDNNLTRKVSLVDATFIAMLKGLIAGTTNLVLALAIGASVPRFETILAAGLLGFFSYGLSLALFVIALRGLGTARTGAYFSTAPFAGAIIAVLLLGEPVTVKLIIAGVVMATGVWLYITERHEHEHTHLSLEHTHEHTHDMHHQHEHAEPVAPGTRHTHSHRHEPLTHVHPHYPDAHHQHDHR